MSHDKNVHDKKMHDKKSYDKKENENIIEGRNAVMEAFRSGKPVDKLYVCLLYTSPSPRDPKTSRMPSSA